MKEFTYCIKDELGIHARPAGEIVKKAGKFSSKITMESGEKTADIKRIFGIMGLGVKCGSTIKIVADGADEEEAVQELSEYFQENL